MPTGGSWFRRRKRSAPNKTRKPTIVRRAVPIPRLFHSCAPGERRSWAVTSRRRSRSSVIELLEDLWGPRRDLALLVAVTAVDLDVGAGLAVDIGLGVRAPPDLADVLDAGVVVWPR